MVTTIVVLAVIGILAFLFELVLPGGILGIAGAICMVAAVVLSFAEFGLMWGIVALVIMLAFAGTMTWIWMKFFHRLPFTRKLVLETAVGSDDELKARQSIVGQTGEALTDLRPSGHAKIGGEKLDVMSESGVIAKGTSIEVVDTRGPSVFVRAV